MKESIKRLIIYVNKTVRSSHKNAQKAGAKALFLLFSSSFVTQD
jgi:hypothetical protein